MSAAVEERVWAAHAPVMRTIRACGPYDVIVKEDPPPQASPGGVQYPDEYVEDHPSCTGEALSCGQRVTFCKPNDRVIFSRLGPSLIHATDFLVMNEAAVFVRLREPCAPEVPFADSLSPYVREHVAAIAPAHALVRPYKPAGFTPGKLYAERNAKHPPIWAWVLALNDGDSARFGVRAGDFVMFKRHSEDEIASDVVTIRAADPQSGAMRSEKRVLPICILKVRNIEAVAQDATIVPDTT